MTNPQVIQKRDWTEEDFVVELKKKSSEELGRFLHGSWIASILSEEAIEELYRYQERRQKEESER